MQLCITWKAGSTAKLVRVKCTSRQFVGTGFPLNWKVKSEGIKEDTEHLRKAGNFVVESECATVVEKRRKIESDYVCKWKLQWKGVSIGKEMVLRVTYNTVLTSDSWGLFCDTFVCHGIWFLKWRGKTVGLCVLTFNATGQVQVLVP